MDNQSIKKLQDIYELIDLFLGGVTSGEKVELRIVPNKETENSQQRILTLAIENGLSRDTVSFYVEDGQYFDQKILPQIFNYYGEKDKYDNSWNIESSWNRKQPSRMQLTTESGNLLYIETFKEDLFETLRHINQTITPSSLKKESLEWQKIIEYAKTRRIARDFYKDSLSEKEREKLEFFTAQISNNRLFIPGIGKISKTKIKNNLQRLFYSEHWEEQLQDIGITKEIYDSIKENMDESLIDKIKSTIYLDQLVLLIQAEKKMNQFIETNHENFSTTIEEFRRKIDFAITEISKTGYYEKKNARYQAFLEGQKFGNTCPKEIEELKQKYETGEIKTKDDATRSLYIKYCNEILEYLKTKAKDMTSKKENITITSDIQFYPYRAPLEADILTDDEKLARIVEIIQSFKKEKNEHKKFEIIVENDELDENKRLAKIILTSTLQKENITLLFENGEYFDKEFHTVIEQVTSNDKIKNVSENNVNVKDFIDEFHTLITTEEGNEILIKLSHPINIGVNKEDSNHFEKKTEQNHFSILTEEDGIIAEYFRKVILRDKGLVTDQEIQELMAKSPTIKEIEEARKKGFPKNNHSIETFNTEIFEKLKSDLYEAIRKQEEERKQIQQANHKFSKLHELVKKYQIRNIDNDLKIIERSTKQEYIPTSKKEKGQIEFATYWLLSTGIISSNEDIELGEKYAFSNELRDFFNIMDIHLEQSIKKGIEIDIQSIRKQFLETNHDKAELIFERLFGNQKQIDYIKSFYMKNLKEENIEYIPNTNIPKPRQREIYETDEEYDIYLKDYYKKAFTPDDTELSTSKKRKEGHLLKMPLEEIKEAYYLADDCSTKEKPAALKIFFPEEETVELIISYGPTNEEEVLLIRKFPKQKFMDEMLQEICNIYIEKSGIVSNQIFEIPNTNKAGSITLGRHDNLLQMSNATKEDVNKIQKALRESSKILEKNKTSQSLKG